MGEMESRQDCVPHHRHERLPGVRGIKPHLLVWNAPQLRSHTIDEYDLRTHRRSRSQRIWLRRSWAGCMRSADAWQAVRVPSRRASAYSARCRPLIAPRAGHRLRAMPAGYSAARAVPDRRLGGVRVWSLEVEAGKNCHPQMSDGDRLTRLPSEERMSRSSASISDSFGRRRISDADPSKDC